MICCETVTAERVTSCSIMPAKAAVSYSSRLSPVLTFSTYYYYRIPTRDFCPRASTECVMQLVLVQWVVGGPEPNLAPCSRAEELAGLADTQRHIILGIICRGVSILSCPVSASDPLAGQPGLPPARDGRQGSNEGPKRPLLLGRPLCHQLTLLAASNIRSVTPSRLRFLARFF